jgi:hypothetical protein
MSMPTGDLQNVRNHYYYYYYYYQGTRAVPSLWCRNLDVSGWQYYQDGVSQASNKCETS